MAQLLIKARADVTARLDCPMFSSLGIDREGGHYMVLLTFGEISVDHTLKSTHCFLSDPSDVRAAAT